MLTAYHQCYSNWDFAQYWQLNINTLGPAYNEFGYYEHVTIPIAIYVKKIRLQRIPLILSTFSWINLFVT